jgi:hypothetical protein
MAALQGFQPAKLAEPFSQHSEKTQKFLRTGLISSEMGVKFNCGKR